MENLKEKTDGKPNEKPNEKPSEKPNEEAEEALSENLQESVDAIKRALPAEDILTFEFLLPSGKECAAIFTDGITNKELLGELVAKPLSEYEGKHDFDEIAKALAAPENKE
ncbi:MAG: hypothetical protein IJY26_01390, partial [Clostridia bacterium]|nr:hypothetical protein [Clostridia bacterium]